MVIIEQWCSIKQFVEVIESSATLEDVRKSCLSVCTVIFFFLNNKDTKSVIYKTVLVINDYALIQLSPCRAY